MRALSNAVLVVLSGCVADLESTEIPSADSVVVNDDADPWRPLWMPLSAPVINVEVAGDRTCAVTDDGRVACWSTSRWATATPASYRRMNAWRVGGRIGTAHWAR